MLMLLINSSNPQIRSARRPVARVPKHGASRNNWIKTFPWRRFLATASKTPRVDAVLFLQAFARLGSSYF
jgi:hypothetical protein